MPGRERDTSGADLDFDFGLMPGRPIRAAVETDRLAKNLAAEVTSAPFVLPPPSDHAYRVARLARRYTPHWAFPSELELSYVQAERLCSAGLFERRGEGAMSARYRAIITHDQLARRIDRALTSANER